MSTSQNGWSVIPTGTDERLVAIPKIVGRVRKGDVATVLTYVVDRFDREVEDIDVGRDDWGYANRPVTGGRVPSNHASGTAVDVNATRHPYGKRGTWTAEQKRRGNAILADVDHVVRWGENYPGTVDGMHLEINASAAAVAKVAARIRGEATPVDNPKSAPPRPAATTKREPRGLPPVLKKGSSGGWVGLWQSILRAVGENVAVDERFGNGTDAATRRVQKRWGLAVDGRVGPRTWLRALLSDASGSLAKGDYSPQVELLQNLLGIKLDRSFGPATVDAVKQLQRYLGIRDDGAVGNATVAALRTHYRA